MNYNESGNLYSSSPVSRFTDSFYRNIFKRLLPKGRLNSRLFEKDLRVNIVRRKGADNPHFLLFP